MCERPNWKYDDDNVQKSKHGFTALPFPFRFTRFLSSVFYEPFGAVLECVFIKIIGDARSEEEEE